MKFWFAFLPLALCFIPVCLSQNCSTKKDLSGAILESSTASISRCWIIEVPENMYIRIKFSVLSFGSKLTCSQSFLRFTTNETKETFLYCYPDNPDHSNRRVLTVLGDVTVQAFHTSYQGYGIYFTLNYHTEDIMCTQKNHFRCSNHTCIHATKVCDKVTDCDNGADENGCEKGIPAMNGVNASQVHAISWLLQNRQSFGWGKNTHRALTALYLANGASFQGQKLEEELMAKQLELQISMALLRNSTEPLSVGDLSMLVNALSVTCHNPRQFYGHDLEKILSERVSASKSPTPGAYLTLCNSKWVFSESEIESLVHLLRKNSTYPFVLDVQAVTVMALTCVKNSQAKEFAYVQETSNIYNKTVEKFIAGQLSDGSFGNVYTTALVTQALLASGQEDNPKWKVASTIEYLRKELNSTSVDFLSVYLTLPILSGRSLVDLAAIKCANISRKEDENNEISDVTNKLGGKISIQYSLFVGDQKDVVHTIYLRLPAQTSAYDVMRVAQVADPKYKFRQRFVSGHMYVYEIAGIINDPEPGKFWLMYSVNKSKTLNHHMESPDKFFVGDDEHLIMWYRTAHI